MIINLTPEEVKSSLIELLHWDALEMQIRENDDGTREVQIPYLMNDAVECFFRLTDTVVHGSLPHTGSEHTTESTEIHLEKTEDRQGILIRAQGSTVSIWYREARKERHCYQYHRIGHNWRKSREGEKIRRLVNLLCVVADKNRYLDLDACNEEENKLWPLIEFAPLCAWSPINDSINDWYPETEKGIQTMLKLAEEIGDSKYAELVSNYLHETISSGIHPSRKKEKTGRLLRDLLSEQEHVCICREIERRLTHASLSWGERIYSSEQTEYMQELRKKTEEKYQSMGYEGVYPLMFLPVADQETVKTLFFVEEHPFTVLEAEEYTFRIFEIFK